MSGQVAFQLLNWIVLPWWAIWIAAPGSRLARRASRHGAVFVALSAIYAVLLVAAVAHPNLLAVLLLSTSLDA